MQISITGGPTTLDGDPIAPSNDPLEYKSLICEALLSPEPGLSPKESYERFALAKKVHESNGEVEITTEEASLIKIRSAAVYAPLLHGQITNLLEACSSRD